MILSFQNASGRISWNELEQTLCRLLTKEKNYKIVDAIEFVNDTFKILDENDDGTISKKEFVMTACTDQNLASLLCEAADKEKKEREIIEAAMAESLLELNNLKPPTEGGNLSESSDIESSKSDVKKKKKKKRKRRKSKHALEKYIADDPSKAEEKPTFTRMSRRRSIF